MIYLLLLLLFKIFALNFRILPECDIDFLPINDSFCIGIKLWGTKHIFVIVNLNLKPKLISNVIALHVQHGNSPKLGSESMKPDLESFFTWKIKNEDNRLIGMVGMIEHLSSTLPSSSNSWRFSKNHCFCDHLEILFSVFTFFY